MKTSTLVDTNVLIDVLKPEGAELRSWSLAHLRDSRERGTIVFSAIVWAELCASFLSQETLSAMFAWLEPRKEAFPFAAACPAGRAHHIYRERGGRRERTLPDFLIGAHALVAGHCLLTRDASRYRGYFPDLDIISPETRP